MSCFVMINQMIQMMFKNSVLQPNSLVVKLLSRHQFKVIYTFTCGIISEIMDGFFFFLKFFLKFLVPSLSKAILYQN